MSRQSLIPDDVTELKALLASRIVNTFLPKNVQVVQGGSENPGIDLLMNIEAPDKSERQLRITLAVTEDGNLRLSLSMDEEVLIHRAHLQFRKETAMPDFLASFANLLNYTGAMMAYFKRGGAGK